MKTLKTLKTLWTWALAGFVLLSFIGFYTHKPTNLAFLTPLETSQFLKADADGYVSMLSIIDLRARGHTTGSDYIKDISENVHQFTEIEKRRLAIAARAADSKLPRTDNWRLAEIPWIFAATSGHGYEGGHPHTRGNIIFLTPSIIRSANIIETLIHEKVHIFQRFSKQATYAFLETKGYMPFASRTEFIRLNPRLRANPDLDDKIWIDTKSRKLFLAEYTTEHPTSINDIIQVNPAFEHPYEAMAYEIARGL